MKRKTQFIINDKQKIVVLKIVSYYSFGAWLFGFCHNILWIFFPPSISIRSLFSFVNCAKLIFCLLFLRFCCCCFFLSFLMWSYEPPSLYHHHHQCNALKVFSLSVQIKRNAFQFTECKITKELFTSFLKRFSQFSLVFIWKSKFVICSQDKGIERMNKNICLQLVYRSFFYSFIHLAYSSAWSNITQCHTNQ